MQRDESEQADEIENEISQRVHEIVNHREIIDQAKGMLRLVHGIDAEKAFELLRWRSQTTNTKLHALAEQVVTEFASMSNGQVDRAMLENAFMTVHERVPSEGDE